MLRRTVLALACFMTCLASYGTAQDQPQTIKLIRAVPVNSELDQTLIGGGGTVVVLTATGRTMNLPTICGSVGGVAYTTYSAI